MRIGDLAATGTRLSTSTWQATVTIFVTTSSAAAVPNALVSGSWTAGAPDTCTTGPSGTCSVQSDVLSRNGTRSVTFRVTDVSHATLVYTPAANLETSITITRP